LYDHEIVTAHSIEYQKIYTRGHVSVGQLGK